MRFTPVIFASVAAASIYWPETSTSTTTTAAKTTSSPAWPVKSDPADYWPEWSSSTSSSTTSSVKKGWKSTTKYETECWTVTSSSSTKVWTSVKAIPTVCEDPDWEWSTTSTKASTPAAPVVTGTWSVPYCEAYTETCTVTVTATGSGAWVSPVVKASSTPVAPVYASTGSWPAGAAAGTGSWTSPYAAQFTGAASAQKAGALLAGAGAVAAMLL